LRSNVSSRRSDLRLSIIAAANASTDAAAEDHALLPKESALTRSPSTSTLLSDVIAPKQRKAVATAAATATAAAAALESTAVVKSTAADAAEKMNFNDFCSENESGDDNADDALEESSHASLHDAR